MAEDRSVADVVQDILRNLQEIIRSEVRLARAEVWDDVTQAATSGIWLTAGLLGLGTAFIFLLWAAAYALAVVMPLWAATLVVAGVAGAGGAVMVATGWRKLKRIKPIPERTVQTMKEHVEWIKQSAK